MLRWHRYIDDGIENGQIRCLKCMDGRFGWVDYYLYVHMKSGTKYTRYQRNKQKWLTINLCSVSHSVCMWTNKIFERTNILDNRNPDEICLCACHSDGFKCCVCVFAVRVRYVLRTLVQVCWRRLPRFLFAWIIPRERIVFRLPMPIHKSVWEPTTVLTPCHAQCSHRQ